MKKSLMSFLEKIDSKDPSSYDFDADQTVDSNIRETLKNINKSSWCWTLYSCEGHRHANEVKTLPYFVFIVKKKHVSFLFNLLMETLNPSVNSQTQYPLINSQELCLSWGFVDESYAIINAHWDARLLEPDLHHQLLKDFYNMSHKILEARL